MTARWWGLLALAVLPAVAGLLLAAFLTAGLLENPPLLLWVVGDAAGVLLTAGLLLTAVLVLVVLREWRARRRLQRTADEVSAAKTAEHFQFMQRLDHELKNPLTAMLAGLANVEAGALLPEQQRALAGVQTQVRRLSQMVRDMRRVGDLETCELDRAPVDVRDVLDEALELARDGFRTLPAVAGEHVLQKDVRESPWPQLAVLGDRDMLLLAVYNLVSNACKYSPAGTTVEVRAFQDGSWVCIEVVDQGTGIAEKDLAHMGEHLYRGQAPRSIPGSGLGLAMVRTIAGRHGGRLVLSSEEGAGTVATLRLPALKSPPSVVVGQEG